jgi:hypothetical protein
MFFWFIGTAVASVWSVFRDPKFAYRWVIVGALIPVFSVVTVVGVLTAVMLLTIGKKAVRKNYLALTIGLFMHLVFDGAFLNTKMFWWPLAGFTSPVFTQFNPRFFFCSTAYASNASLDTSDTQV